MSLVIDQTFGDLGPKQLIVCEGMGDVHLVRTLLEQNHINTCQIGCPGRTSVQGMGKEKIGAYLDAARTQDKLKGITLTRFLVIGDADESAENAFAELCAQLRYANLPVPSVPYVTENVTHEGNNLKIGTYIIPGNGKQGTLEHLLLEAVADAKKECAEKFLGCIGRPANVSSNQLAKMRLSVIVGASCHKNPWASAAMMLCEKNKPISFDSPSFVELLNALKAFSE